MCFCFVCVFFSGCAFSQIRNFFFRMPNDGKCLLNTKNKQTNKQCIKEPWKSTNATYYDTITINEWLLKETYTQEAKNLATIAVRAILCAEPCEISLLYWLWYIKNGHGIMRLTDTDNGAQVYLFPLFCFVWPVFFFYFFQ